MNEYFVAVDEQDPEHKTSGGTVKRKIYKVVCPDLSDYVLDVYLSSQKNK